MQPVSFFGATAVRPRRHAGLAAVLIAVIGLAGCGSDDSGETAQQADSSAAADSAQTGEFANAQIIRDRVVGNTVTGTMSPDSAYTEFYAEDGSIHGASYEARWTIQDDQMCFDYDEAPEIDCYRVKIDGDSIEWHRQDEVQGKGTLVEGNPNNF